MVCVLSSTSMNLDETTDIIKELRARKINFGTKSMTNCQLLKRSSAPKIPLQEIVSFSVPCSNETHIDQSGSVRECSNPPGGLMDSVRSDLHD